MFFTFQMNSDNKKILIIKDRKKGFSLGKLANKYAISQSTIQYMIRSYGKQHKKTWPKRKNYKERQKTNANNIKSTQWQWFEMLKSGYLGRFELKSIQEYSLPKSEVVIVRIQEIAT